MELPFRGLPRGTEGDHEKPVARPRFEPGISRL